VRYIYDESPTVPTTTATKSDILTRAAIDSLPPDLVAEFRRAIIELDAELMQTFIAQICKLNQPLANTLAASVYNFQYEYLLDLTQPSNPEA